MPVSELSRGVATLLPEGWTDVQALLESESSEARLLIEILLDRVSVGDLTRVEAGLFPGEAAAQIFVAKAEAIALFAICAENYGIFFDLERQLRTLVANTDLADLAEDLGMQVTRAGLPYLLETVKVDYILRGSGELPSRTFPLDVLGAIANRVRDWYEDSLGAALIKFGRHTVIGYDMLADQISEELKSAYDRYQVEIEEGVEHGLAMDALRRFYGA